MQLKEKLEEDVKAGKITSQQRDQIIAQHIDANKKAYAALESKLLAEEEELVAGIQEQCDRDKVATMREAHEALLMEVGLKQLPNHTPMARWWFT